MIDLIEDKITEEFLNDTGFNLYELYEIHGKLVNLKSIKREMINNSKTLGLNNSLGLHRNHLGIIRGNIISINKVIKDRENGITMDLGELGRINLN
jgi:hypothetical protein